LASEVILVNFVQKFRNMILQLEISDPQDAELILTLVRRLNIPFRHKMPNVEVDKTEKDKRRQRILNFKAKTPSSFGDALEWQLKERQDRPLPFGEIK